MKNRKFLSAITIILALFAVIAGILILGAGAKETQEVYVVDGVGGGENTFATIRDALLSASGKATSWGSGSSLIIKLTSDQTVDSTDNDILFDVSTIFTSDNKKLPITITSDKSDGKTAVILLTVEGSIQRENKSLPHENWHCTNDYTFLNVEIKTDKAGQVTYPDLMFLAGSGNVVFDGVKFGTTETGEENVNLFFAADNNTANFSNAEKKLFDTWTEKSIKAEKDRYGAESEGLLRTSLTFKNTTYNHMPSTNWQCPWLMVKRSRGTTFAGKDGAVILPEETEARVIVDEGADLGRIAGFSSSNAVYTNAGKIVIEVKGGKARGISADSASYFSGSPSGKAKHAVVDIILSGGTVDALSLNGAVFAVTGGAHSDYDATSEVNIYVEKGAVVNGNICGIGGLGTVAAETKHILTPKGKVNIHLNGGTVNGAVYGIAPDKVAHNVGGNININLNGSAVTGNIYGANNKGTVSGNILITFNADFAGTASAMNAGSLEEGGKAGVLVQSGTVNGTVSAVCGTATVKKGAEAYLKITGGTVKKQFLMTNGKSFSVEEGGKVSAYLHGGNLQSGKIGANSGYGTVFSTTSKNSYGDVDTAYTKNGILTYPDDLKKGSTVYIEIGQAESYSTGSYFAPVHGGVVGGDLYIKYLPGVKFAGTGVDTIRNIYGSVVLGDYTLEINPDGKETIDATGVAIQGEWSGKVLGDAFVTAKNLKCQNFFSVAGKNSTTTLDTVEASGLIGFSRGSYNTSFDVVGEEKISRIKTITNHFINCTTPDLYAVGHNYSAAKMDATIVNNFTGCTVTKNLICGGYRYYYDGKTNASILLGTITSNFLGGNKIEGTLYGGSSSSSSSSCSSSVVNETGSVIINFKAPASNPDTIGTFYAGNGVEGSTIPKETSYRDGTVEKISVTVGENTTFSKDVFVGSLGGTLALETECTVNGGTFQGAVKGADFTVNGGRFEANLSGEDIVVTGGVFLGTVSGNTISLKGGDFHSSVTADTLTLLDGASISIQESGAIFADAVLGYVTICKADAWGSFDTVYVKAPAEAARLITVTDVEESRAPFILSDRYEVRGWYPALYASIVLRERIYLKLSMDSVAYKDFEERAGTPTFTVTYGGTKLNLTAKDLTGGGFWISAEGAHALDLILSYDINGEELLSTSIYKIATNGAIYYADYKEIANLFHAIAQYGNAATGREVEFTTAELLLVQRYGNNEANIDPKKMSLSRDKNYNVDFTGVTLLMGDTIGLRLKASDLTKSNLAKSKVYLDSISPENLLVAEKHYLLKENSIDLFIHAKDFKNIANIIVVDQNGNVCLDMKYSVAYIMYELVKNDVNGTDKTDKGTLDNPKLQATSLLIMRIDEYLEYLNPTEEEKDIILPAGHTVGYARIDCTPAEPLAIYDATAYTAADSLMITCTAISDGENAALIMSLDLKGITRGVSNQAMKLIEERYGIPGERIMMSATHSHSAPTLGSGNSAAMTRYIAYFYKQLDKVVGNALADLAPAEAYAGKAYPKEVAFVRRYLLADGTYKTNPSAADKPVEHESVADNELRVLHFKREGKKDIVLMNFQTHYGLYKEAYSADFIYNLRQMSESEMDIHFAYYSGASGNLNMTNRLGTTDKNRSVNRMWEGTKEAMETAESIQMGKVCGATSLYPAKVLKDSEERVAQAKEIDAETDEAKKAELMKLYGFGSSRWVQGVLTRATLDEIQEIPFSAITFGDIAFSSSPIEQFDANAKWVRENSPFTQMTFTLSLTNGSYGYVPTAEAFPHGSYEVAVSRYIPGSGEEFAAEQVRLLQLCYEAQQ